jgi:hypothetical protein
LFSSKGALEVSQCYSQDAEKRETFHGKIPTGKTMADFTPVDRLFYAPLALARIGRHLFFPTLHGSFLRVRLPAMTALGALYPAYNRGDTTLSAGSTGGAAGALPDLLPRTPQGMDRDVVTYVTSYTVRIEYLYVCYRL